MSTQDRIFHSFYLFTHFQGCSFSMIICTWNDPPRHIHQCSSAINSLLSVFTSIRPQRGLKEVGPNIRKQGYWTIPLRVFTLTHSPLADSMRWGYSTYYTYQDLTKAPSNGSVTTDFNICFYDPNRKKTFSNFIIMTLCYCDINKVHFPYISDTSLNQNDLEGLIFLFSVYSCNV